jgi:hypothetical protein
MNPTTSSLSHAGGGVAGMRLARRADPMDVSEGPRRLEDVAGRELEEVDSSCSFGDFR